MLLATIPIWQNFSEKYSSANVIESDEYNLKFKVRNKDNMDTLTVNNDFILFKNFKIYLKVNKELAQNTSVIINGTTYNVNDFKMTKKRNSYLYNLVVDSLYGGEKNYNINLELNQDNVKYSYILEEIEKF